MKEELLKLDLKMSAYDEALFYWRCDGKCRGLTAAHGDDFFWSGSAKVEDNVINRLRSTFKIGTEEEKVFKYIGIEVHHNKEVIEIGQNTYVAGICATEFYMLVKKKSINLLMRKNRLNSVRCVDS